MCIRDRVRPSVRTARALTTIYPRKTSGSYKTEFTLVINLRMFKYTAKTVAPFFKLKSQMSIPDLLSITVDATLGSQARISPLLVMVNIILH